MSGDNAEQAYIRHSILLALKSNLAQQIDFWCNWIHVDGAGFLSVHQALLIDYMHVAVDHTLDHDMMQYSSADKTFYVPRSNFGNPDSLVAEKALMIHESVHALVDWSFRPPAAYLTDITSDDPSLASTRYHPGLKLVEEEAAAYVAQALHLINYYDDGGPGNIPEFQIALPIARRIKGTPGARVTDVESALLQGVIAADPRYQKELARVWSS
jgi:hypothetical protein